MTSFDFEACDVDNHYYETEDAFTRHLDPALAGRAVSWCETGGARRMMVAGRLLDFVPNDTFDPVARPGALDEWFRGKNAAGKPMMDYYQDMEPLQPAYVDRKARLELMDRQGLESAFLFPTMGCGLEEALKDDVEALAGSFTAFNRWLDEEWGFSFEERLFAAPAITLADPDRAMAEVEWALARDARTLYLRPNPVAQDRGYRSLADPAFDAFWQLAHEAGITISFHQADTVYQSHAAYWIPKTGSSGLEFGANPMRAVMHMRAVAAAISETLSALICGGVFTRFPNLRVASVENGGDWVPSLLRRLAMAYGQMPWAFSEDPAETFRRHVWVAPFQGEDFRALADLIGADRVLFGSDFPHPEGVAAPLRFADDMQTLSAEERRLVMRENTLGLTRRQPV